MRRRIAMAAAAVPVLLLSTTGAWAFSASFAWCAGSPRFTLQDVPAGTTQLQFAMTDLNKPSFHHGGGTVDFAVKALGASGAALATTTARRKFPE